MLDLVYQKLYDASSSYILIAEYYNPSPVTISYRGHQDRLFKRDFAGEFLNKLKDIHEFKNRDNKANTSKKQIVHKKLGLNISY